MVKKQIKGTIQALYTLEVKDKNGKIVSKVTKPCKSFVIAFLKVLEVQSMAVTLNDLVGTDGAPDTCTKNADSFWCDGVVGDTARGILVGTGTTGVTNTDYTMETIINHGVGAGQLSYGATGRVTTAVVGANVDFQLLRTFTNGSGNTINVTEVGIYGQITGAHRVMLLHEIVVSTPVANGQTLTVTITYRITV